MEPRNWWKDHLAFSIKFEWLWWLLAFALAGGFFLIAACCLLLLAAPKVGVVVIAVLVLAVILLVSAFKVKIKGKKFFVFENVPATNALVLRWLFSSKKSQQSDYDARADKTMCVSLSTGLVFYSPLLFERAALVDLKTRVIQIDPIEVNDLEGNLIAVDVQLSYWVVDTILFFLNLANDHERMVKVLKEYLHTALRRMVSTGEKEFQLKNPDETVEKLTGWKCTTLGLTQSGADVQRRMGTFVSWLIKHWLTRGGDGNEQFFGVEAKVKITSIQAPEVLAAAQEGKAAAETEADQVTIQARGYAAMAKIIADQITDMVPKEVRTRLFEVIQDPATSPETVGECASFLRGVYPNATVLTAVLSLIPAARDFMEALRGGKRARVSSGEQTGAQGGGGSEKPKEKRKGRE